MCKSFCNDTDIFDMMCYSYVLRGITNFESINFRSVKNNKFVNTDFFFS